MSWSSNIRTCSSERSFPSLPLYTTHSHHSETDLCWCHHHNAYTNRRSNLRSLHHIVCMNRQPAASCYTQYTRRSVHFSCPTSFGSLLVHHGRGGTPPKHRNKVQVACICVRSACKHDHLLQLGRLRWSSVPLRWTFLPSRTLRRRSLGLLSLFFQ